MLTPFLISTRSIFPRYSPKSVRGGIYVRKISTCVPRIKKGAVVRPKHRRKNPPPTILEEQGEGIVLLADGEPHDPCPVAGCRGTLRFLHQ
jgi:hypothetical protein